MEVAGPLGTPLGKKAKWLSGEALQIAVKRREAKSKGAKEIYTEKVEKRENERTNRNLEGRSRDVKGDGVGILVVCFPSDPLGAYPCLPSPTTVSPTQPHYRCGQ